MTVQQEQKQTISILRGKDALKDTCAQLGIKLGKRSQAKSAACDPRSPYFDSAVSKRRAKNKARRRFNARMRAREGK